MKHLEDYRSFMEPPPWARYREIKHGNSRHFHYIRGLPADTVAQIQMENLMEEDAVFWIDARRAVEGEPRVVNHGTGGTALDATYGSVLGAYIYGGAAVLPGVSGNYVSTPDAAALDASTEVELVVLAALTDWTPGSSVLLSKRASSQWSYQLSFSSGGFPQFVGTSDGSTAAVATASAKTAHTDGQFGWIKVTWRSSDGRVQFFTGPYDGTLAEPTFTQLGTDQTVLSGSELHAGTSPVEIGSTRGGANDLSVGRFLRAIIRTTIDGTTVLDVNPSVAEDYATSFTAATGQTVTVNSTSADTNDPKLLTHTGDNYVYIPGSNDNGLSVLDEAALDITGPIECVARVRSDDFQPSQSIVSKWLGTAGQYSYVFRINNYTMDLYISNNGTSTRAAYSDSIVDAGLVEGEWYWFKWTVDSQAGTAAFYYAEDQETEPSSWTSVPVGVPLAGGGWDIHAGTEDVHIGSLADGTQVLNGGIKRALLRDDIGGATVLDVDLTTDVTDAGATSFTATSGQTVTVNRSTSGRKLALVTRPIWLLGTDDYFEVADNDLLDVGATDTKTAVLICRAWDTMVNYGAYMGKRSNTGSVPYWHVPNVGTTIEKPYLTTDDGTNTRATAAAATQGSDGELVAIFAYVAPSGVSTSQLDDDTPATSTTGAGLTLANSAPMMIGAVGDAGSPNGASFSDLEVVAAAFFDRALTTDEITTIVEGYGTV